MHYKRGKQEKGQLRYAGKDVYAQNKLINKIFGLAA
jgi:hypothetical protein